MEGGINFFTKITDPRAEWAKIYSVEEIIFISISSVICGAETWNDIEQYGNSKVTWLRTFLPLPNGIPSHDTFNRFFSLINPKELEECFLEWVKDIAELTEGEVVSIDGKTIRGSRSSDGKSFIHIVSAWANKNQLCLGQIKVGEKSNEITAIPKLLNILALKGCIVTIDAMGCQKKIAKKIIAQEADYILGAKKNHPSLYEAIEEIVRFTKPTSIWEDHDLGHGRIEHRVCSIYSDLSTIENKDDWKGLNAIVKIESKRIQKKGHQEQSETRFYITSLQTNAEIIGKAVRSHWGIENSLHWVLDVAFNEDSSQKKNKNAVENFSILNKIALHLIRSEVSKKRSIKGKRLNAGWDNDYLLKILGN